MRRILLAMSGGVDSSTAGVLLEDEGYQVVGCTMQLWDQRRNPPRNGSPRPGRCCSLDDVYDARRVAEHRGFPFYVLNLQEQFQRNVVEPFIGGYLGGRTPVPCTLCNTFLKFDELLVFGRRIGIQQVATGHYARIGRDEDGDFRLLRGRDPGKDQSYYLFELNQEQLSRIRFPLGELEKTQVRRIATENGLVTADKAESQEICFVTDGDYGDFIRRHAGEVQPDFQPRLRHLDRPGPVLFKDGTRLGTHAGAYRFTVGQRKGLGVAHPRPLYVLRLDVAANAVIVGYREDLYRGGLVADRVNWISRALPSGSVRAQVRIRARHQAAPATVTLRSGAGEKGELQAEVRFDFPEKAVTPGQAAVFYQGERVLGGGWISRALEC